MLREQRQKKLPEKMRKWEEEQRQCISTACISGMAGDRAESRAAE